MSHPTLWRCARSPCPGILGKIEDGRLIVVAPSPAVTEARVIVTCPLCGTVRSWYTEASPPQGS